MSNWTKYAAEHGNGGNRHRKQIGGLAFKIFASSLAVFIVSLAQSLAWSDVCSTDGLARIPKQGPNCIDSFALLQCASTPKAPTETDLNRLSPKGSPAVAADKVEPLRRERDRLKSQLQLDFREIESSPQAAANSYLFETLSPESVQISKKMASLLADGMKQNGFEVEVRKRPSFNQIHKGIIYEVPEREVLVIRPGTAKGPLARELDRIQKYIKNKKAKGDLSPEIKESDYEFFVDPLLTVSQDLHGFFSSSKAVGEGIHLAPGTLFNSQDTAVEILRHELRHLKVHFDNSGTAAAPYRFTVHDNSGIDELGAYRHAFAIDEVEGTLSNLKTVQSKMGRETEAYRKQRREMDPNSDSYKKLTRTFRKSLEKMQKEAEGHIRMIEKFLTHSISTAAEARSLLADPAMTSAKFESIIKTKEYTTIPDQSSIEIRLGGELGRSGRTLTVLVPRMIVARGADAIREFTLQNLTALDSLLLERSRELQIRRSDISRPATDRLQAPPTN